MRSFVKWNLVVLTFAVGLACASGAYADTLSWTISDGGITGSGTMAVPYDCSQGIGSCTITSFSGALTIGAAPAVTFSGAPVSTSQSGNYGFNWDNLVFPADDSSGAYLDNDGVMFYVPASSTYFNLWGNSPGGPGTYSLWNWVGGGYGIQVNDTTFAITGTAVPEPSALSLLTLGLLG